MKLKRLFTLKNLPIMILGVAVVGYVVKAIVEQYQKDQAKKASDTEPSQLPTVVVASGGGTISNNSIVQPITRIISTLSPKFISNGGYEVFDIPTSGVVLGEHYHSIITTDISSEKNILYKFLPIDTTGFVRLEITNQKGVDFTTQNLSISTIKIS